MQPCIKKLDGRTEFYIDEGCYVVELTSVAEDPDLSIARCRVEPGKTTAWHRLAGTVERYIIQQGQGCVEVGDLPPQAVGAGDVVVIPAGCRQRIRNTTDQDLLFFALCTPRFSPEIYTSVPDGL